MYRHIATAGGALDESAEPTEAGYLDSVRITLGAASATSENLVVSIVSAKGPEYNVTLNSQDMNTLSYYVLQPTRRHPFFKGDKIRVTWANSNAVTWGLEIIWR